MRTLWQQLYARYESLRHDKNHPMIAPNGLYLLKDEFFAHVNQYARVQVLSDAYVQKNNADAAAISTKHAKNAFMDAQILPIANVAAAHAQNDNALKSLAEFIKTCPHAVAVVLDSDGRRQIVQDLLPIDCMHHNSFKAFLRQKQSGMAHLLVGNIDDVLYLANQNDGFCIISEAQIFGRQSVHIRQKHMPKLQTAVLIKNLSELKLGDLVVHIEHGIGRYNGLVVMDMGAGEAEFIHLLYADEASIYVPISHIGLIGKYSGADAVVSLSKIGSGKWSKARQKALTQIYDVAAELLHNEARRKAFSGIKFDIDWRAYELFASGFEYDETPDQALAINAVLKDMAQTKPMDRLICGDVGFGKTEVAMRAAFVAVQAGYQVAVLVPTTLLAGQHSANFTERFAKYPINIASVSRFNKKTQQSVLQNLKDGKIDIIIGTHKLLQDDVVFKKLGLMIVDEEHRFGVRHKAKIKSMQTSIDSLFMTATPIPRTLNMALSGMQDISIITTAPARRLPIKTFVVEKNKQTILDGIRREILRGGQVYYLHNDIKTIAQTAQSIEDDLPNVRTAIAHGQMDERELAKVMDDFYHKRFNVLVATTIIETGIDIPNANTIIINRADKFGLAQLHQLRGRVGRAHHQAYCYLLIPSIKGLSCDAKKRLDAISYANTLGAGFMLASEDLQIRGAGEILGKAQSGNMQTIGFGLYMDMLARATKAIKQNKTPNLDAPLDLISDVNLHMPALIDSDYVTDVQQRLQLYKRLNHTQTKQEIDAFKAELIDRFGAMSQYTSNLFLVQHIRILALSLKISKIDASAQKIDIHFEPDTPVQAIAIIQLMQQNQGFKMLSATHIRQTLVKPLDDAERFNHLLKLLDYFYQHSKLDVNADN